MSAQDVHDEQRAASERGDDADRSHGGRAVFNWVLAALSVVGALAVVAFAYLKVLGAAACTDRMCGELGPGETAFGLILYGTPVVAVVAVLLSFFTARRRLGVLVPVCAWIVVVAALLALVLTF